MKHFSDPASCACFNLRKAARAITQHYDEALKPSGLRATQFSILAVLSKLTPAPVARLSQVLVMDRTTLTRNLKPLVGQGLIAIQPGEEDRRRRCVLLTVKGGKALKAALPHWQAVQEQVIGRLTPARWRRMEKDLEHAVTAAGE
jgi:DNA-binding MarR family transcriptional regulator